ncbi:MAG: glycosyl transferase [Candidatus Heimdallarchaeota archaeon]|nr:glycosyl transferase [Candidatus Heimdallarchaeota archaeon]
MEHYVTLFDSLFLPQGLALHESLEKCAGEYCLWILCVDKDASNVLCKLSLPNVKLIKLDEVETPELLEVKKERTRAEYCWTLTPFAPRFVFEASFEVKRVTYIDADMWFLKNPEWIFNELEKSEKNVLITDHAYAAEYDHSATSGQYCVQFVTFIRDSSEPVRKWWEERCIEWCYNRIEDGKFGDQKYLDDWPQRFENHVHVLERQEWMLAPWNASRFPYSNAVMYHFHGVRLLKNNSVNLGSYKLPKVLLQYVYKPYIGSLKQAVAKLNKVGYIPKEQQAKIALLRIVKDVLFGFYTQLWQFKIIHVKKL